MADYSTVYYCRYKGIFCQYATWNNYAADVVEVVRCKDCKHRHDDNFCGGRGWPAQLVPDDGYCDKGAKGEGKK